MKNDAPLFIAIANIFSFGGFAQGNTELMPDSMSGNELAVVSYHVEERINMTFGSRITTYDVPSLSLVSTNDLGPNNIRIVTPKFAKPKQKAVAITLAAATVAIELPKAPVAIPITIVQPVKIDAPAREKETGIAYIDILGTYERILDKGYQSIDMLKRVGNNRFFEGNLPMAAKWYARLFALTTDFEAVYYYRYAQALKSISQVEKANEMMAIFENKNL